MNYLVTEYLIAKGAPRYIKNVIAGKVARPVGAKDIDTGPNGPTLNPVYVRVQRAKRGQEAARAKAMGDESGYRGLRIYGETYGRMKPGQPAAPDLQERLARHKRDKAIAAREARLKQSPAPAPAPAAKPAAKPADEIPTPPKLGGKIDMGSPSPSPKPVAARVQEKKIAEAAAKTPYLTNRDKALAAGAVGTFGAGGVYLGTRNR